MFKAILRYILLNEIVTTTQISEAIDKQKKFNESFKGLKKFNDKFEKDNK